MSEQTQPQTETPKAEFIGRYRIVSEIGRGAMGIVYRGEDEALGRSVAIKTILASMDDEEQAGYLARFKQEAKALGGLNHPSIITVYEFGDQNGVAYFAMEYLQGEELRSVIARKQLDLATAVELAAQIAEGLAFAHSHGVVHRDIKPGNIWVVDGKRAKIMDFGIARVRTSDVKTQTGLMLGSPKYMSPEQVLGNPVDNRSDVFSLGVVLHEMITGTPPFQADDVPALMYQVCNAHPAPPSAKNLGITRTLDLIVARALEKDPAVRYQDAGAMAWDLRACLPELTTGTPGEVSALVAAPMAPSPPPIATPAPTAGTAGLHVSGRFDSAAALERLTKPHGEDRRALSPAAGPAPIPQRWLADGPLMAALALIAGAAAAAWFIATH